MQCKNCDAEFEAKGVEFLGVEMFKPIYCDPCAIKLSDEYDRESEERERQAISERNIVRWNKICAELYRDTDHARLPQKPLQRALAWRFGPRGLVLYGSSGAGKTRILYCVLRRLFDEGWRMQIYTGAEFKRAYAQAAGKGDGEKWVDKIGSLDILAIDDLGQTKMTDASEEAFLDVLELRARTQKPTLFTTQYTGDILVKQFTREERGHAVGRRLREFCDTIHVKQ